MTADFITSISFDTFSVELIIADTATLALANAYTDEKVSEIIAGSAHVIQDNETSKTKRAKLNFIGAIVEDDAINDATKITIPQGGLIDSISFDGVEIEPIAKNVELSGVVAKYNGETFVSPVGESIAADVTASLYSDQSNSATTSIQDQNGNVIHTTYATKTENGFKVPYTGATSNVDLGTKGLTTEFTQYNVDNTPIAPSEGLLQWNATDGTLDLGLQGGLVTGQLFQEQFIRVKNNSGATLFNGKCIYIDTADVTNGRPTAMLANNTSADMARKTIGILTDNILDGNEGFATTFGKVRGLNTSAFTRGQILYVSETSGELTNTKPTGAAWITNVGVVTVVSTTVGEIFIRSIQYEKPDELTLISGFPNQNTPETNISIVVVANLGVFTIAPKLPATEFHFYQLGVQYRKLTSESITLSDVEGLHWLYYDLGILSDIANPTVFQAASLIENKTLVSQVYWDATNKLPILIGNERHGFMMSNDTHSYLYLTQGAKWISGMALNTINAVGNGNSDSHAQFGVDLGLGTDEDLRRNPSSILSTAGLPIFYLDGASANLRRKYQPGFSVLSDTVAGVAVPTGRLAYNRLLAGVWSLQTVSSDDFVLCHVFATNDSATTPAQPYIAFVGQALYTTLTNARTGASSEIGSIISIYPKQELIPVATVIFQTNLSYTNSINARVVEVATGISYVDWRTSDIKASASAIPTDHNSLSGKQGGIVGEYYHLTAAQVIKVDDSLTTVTHDTTLTGLGTAASPLSVDAKGAYAVINVNTTSTQTLLPNTIINMKNQLDANLTLLLDATNRSASSSNEYMIELSMAALYSLTYPAVILRWAFGVSPIITANNSVFLTLMEKLINTTNLFASSGTAITGTAFSSKKYTMSFTPSGASILTAKQATPYNVAKTAATTATAATGFFTAAMVGLHLYIGTTYAGQITAYTSATVVTTTSTATISSGAASIGGSISASSLRNEFTFLPAFAATDMIVTLVTGSSTDIQFEKREFATTFVPYNTTAETTIYIGRVIIN